jgi:hypothetical protein
MTPGFLYHLTNTAFMGLGKASNQTRWLKIIEREERVLEKCEVKMCGREVIEKPYGFHSVLALSGSSTTSL